MTTTTDSRCIFCRSCTRGTVSEEHVIPESLGNVSHVLPPGIVCDKCNNYFASKVEKPVLNSPRFRVIRGMQEIPNKRKRFPFVNGMASCGIPIEFHRERKTGTPHIVIPEGSGDALFNHVEKTGTGRFYLPTDSTPPPKKLFSRFLGMVAVEAMALRLIGNREHLTNFIDDDQLDVIREHARRGTTADWPFNERRIYSQDADVIHEFDFLVTPESEMYFVLAIFGLEFAINVAGPTIDGYQKWLRENGDQSPLYAGKNQFARPPIIAE